MTGWWFATLPFLVAACAAWAAPEIKRIDARYSSNGVELVISGNELAGARDVWTTLTQQAGLVSITESEIRAHVPGAVSPNLYWARVFGSNGVSVVAPFVVDELTTMECASTNTSRQRAQEIAVPCAVRGTARELGFTWFRFHARSGQRVAVETMASHMGSRLDSVVRVTDARGREVAYSDDAPGLRGDSHASFIVEQAGDYFIELRDIHYGGGGDFNYRLRIGDFPFAATTYPIAVTAGGEATLQLVGAACSSGDVRVTAPAGTSFVPIAHQGAYAKAMVSEVSEVREDEGAVLEAPCAVNGRFDKGQDRDVYEVRVTAGQKLVIRAHTRSAGSACDAELELQTTNGQRLARSNIGAADEGVITHTFKDAGIHRLIVTEATGAHGPSLVYRVSVQPAAGFTLSVEADTVQAAPGGEFDVKVAAARSDYKGEIQLDLRGVAGLNVSNAVIHANQTNTTMKVRVPDDLDIGVARFFEVIGRAASEEVGPSERASTAPALRKRWPQMLHVPFELDGWVALGMRQSLDLDSKLGEKDHR